METGEAIHFASDAAGFGRFQRYLDRHSPDPRDFLILLEPTGSYGLTVLLHLLGKGYRVLQVDNRAVKTTGRRSSAAKRRPTTPMPD